MVNFFLRARALKVGNKESKRVCEDQGANGQPVIVTVLFSLQVASNATISCAFQNKPVNK